MSCGAVQISWVVFLALAAGCASTQGPRSTPATLPPAAEESAGRPLPGDPVLVELATDRAYVVQLAAAEESAENGQLQVASAVPGAVVSVDGEDPVPLPVTLELPTGYHDVVATCPDSSTETMNVSVEAGAAVHLQVCAGLLGP